MRLNPQLILIATLALATACSPASSEESMMGEEQKLNVAHRGASAYAPEHTREAYELALAQGADFLEPDLQVTRDGVLICLHDLTLERTTNVADVFPDRYREVEVNGRLVQRWFAHDFTLEEIKRLDAGSWFDERFSGARVLTLAEAIEIADGNAGLIPETKSPELYLEQGLDMEGLLVAELERRGLHVRGANPATPVVIQSFSAESLRRLRHELGSDLPLTLLVSAGDRDGWLTTEGLARAAEFADGIGPTKSLLLTDPAAVGRAHDVGLTVIPWTFRSSNTGDFPDVTAEMAYFLYELGVDGVFTDNPDLFPRADPSRAASP